MQFIHACKGVIQLTMLYVKTQKIKKGIKKG